jgi:hypothetical protein
MYRKETNNAYKILVGKMEGNRPFGKPRLKWKNNIKIGLDLKETGHDYVNWIHLARVGSSGGLL